MCFCVRKNKMKTWRNLVKLYNEMKFSELEKYFGDIYHYTSPEGLKGILDSESMFATDMLFLNDKSENMYVIDIVKNNLDILCNNNLELRKDIEREIKLIKAGRWEEKIHNYTISFCMEKDVLGMWNYYTKGNSIQGYALEINAGKLAKELRIEILDTEKKPVWRNQDKHLVLFEGKVIYDETKQLQIVKYIFEKFIDVCATEEEFENNRGILAHLIMEKVIGYGKFFKAPAFKSEKEYRFIYSTYLMENEEFSKMGIPYKELFRVKDGCFIPYQKCKFNLAAIKTIMFSPSLYNEVTCAGLRRMLDNKEDSKHIEIEESGIPLRY